MQPLVINYQNYDPQINSVLFAPDDVIVEIFDGVENVQDFVHFEFTCKKTAWLFIRLMPNAERMKRFAEACEGLPIEKNFPTKIFLTRSENYRIPAEEVTPQYFRIVRAITNNFDKSWTQIIRTEANIRRFLKNNANGAFERIAAEYLDPSDSNPKICKLEAELRIKLETEIAVISAKMLVLRGPDNFNGTIHAAYLNQVAAQSALDASVATFLNAYRAAYKINKPLLELVALNFTTSAVQTAKIDYITKRAELETAEKKFRDLRNELDGLAIFIRGNVVGGAFYDFNGKLNYLNAAAQTKASYLSQYFQWLNLDIPTGYEEEYYFSLGRVMGECFLDHIS